VLVSLGILSNKVFCLVLYVTNSNQSRYKSHTKWATTCTIGSSRYKNIKPKKKEKKKRISIALEV
jgi:hypothetical protein